MTIISKDPNVEKEREARRRKKEAERRN